MVDIRFILVTFVFAGVAIITSGGQVLSATNPFAVPTIKGRLLTPQEGCGHSKVLTKRIVGGSAAKNGAYPWIGLLGFNRTFIKSYNKITFDIEFSTKLSLECGASLITSKHVLTAAHCIDEELILVRLGEYDTSTTTDGDHQDVSIDHVVKHEEFDGVQMINDLAIIHLAHDVDFTDRIRPVCLPIDGDIVYRDFVGSNPFVAGWGDTSTADNGVETTILQQLQVPVVEMKECQKKYLEDRADPKRKNADCELKAKIVFDEHVLCAGHLEGGKSIYFGDSGGPLMLTVYANGTFPYYQIGIASGTEGCGGESGVLGMYASIQYYADWIHENLKPKNSTE